MQLAPGAYDGATRYPFQNSNQPGLSFSGNGRGCNTLTGRFDVHEATFASTGYLERFRATFEQHCEGGEPALYGEVHIINPPPPPVLEVTLVIDPTARVERLSGRAYVTATFACTTPTNLGIAATLDQRLTRPSRATATGCLTSPCSSAPTTATIEIIPFGNVPFGNGMAMLDLVANGYDYNYNNFVRVSFKQPLRLAPR